MPQGSYSEVGGPEIGRFFIVTGGPGSGKTTLIEALAAHGLKHRCLDQAVIKSACSDRAHRLARLRPDRGTPHSDPARRGALGAPDLHRQALAAAARSGSRASIGSLSPRERQFDPAGGRGERATFHEEVIGRAGRARPIRSADSRRDPARTACPPPGRRQAHSGRARARAGSWEQPASSRPTHARSLA
jgi:hypothetical protein